MAVCGLWQTGGPVEQVQAAGTWKIMSSSELDITPLGETNFRNQRVRFGIHRADRRGHVYVIGKTGTGKSTLLETMIRSDLEKGEGLALLDPHGDLAERVIKLVSSSRLADLIYFDAGDTKPLGFNPLETVSAERRAFVASGLISVFQKIWHTSWGPRLEYILRNCLLTLLDVPGMTLLNVTKLLGEPQFRRWCLQYVGNARVRDFWTQEYERYPPNFRAEAISPIQNKIGEFAVHPVLQRILGQKRSAFNLRALMDEGKCLVVNLAKGRIGEDAASLLGSLLVTQFGLAALSRTDTPEASRRDFYLYLDEFPSFTTLAFTNMLAESRKYRLCLTMAHQHLGQLDEAVKKAILGNVGTAISFRLGVADALELEKEFWPDFWPSDLVNLPKYHVYLKLMINGLVSKPFSAVTLPPFSSA